MKRSNNIFALLLTSSLLLGTQASESQAWEAATTHAGLTEESAFSANLHKLLSEQFGVSRGLYTMLTVPEADAPSLFQILRRLNPTHGYVPNAKGKMSALSWLVAGSVVADVPTTSASNHFFDPRSGASLSGTTAGGAGRSLARLITGASHSDQVKTGGEAAITWWKSEANGMGYPGFADQFRKAVSSASQAERERHLAGSLLAAGSMLHVLQDMGSPSHVRNDIAAHREQIGSRYQDRGSRFERIAALAFGRLGIPKSKSAPALPSLDAHFSNAERSGLADIIEANYFSSGTLPRETKVKRDAGSSVFRQALESRLHRPSPSPHSRLDVVAARNAKGATWLNEDGVCLSRYRWQRARVSFWMDDECALEQLEAILPTVGAYSTSFLERLYPGDLGLSKKAGKILLSVDAKRYGEGTVRAFADSADGTRSEYHSVAASPGKPVAATLPVPPSGTRRVTLLFDGRDSSGAPLLATTTSPWPIPKKKKK
jgi:hypothetical protein